MEEVLFSPGFREGVGNEGVYNEKAQECALNPL